MDYRGQGHVLASAIEKFFHLCTVDVIQPVDYGAVGMHLYVHLALFRY